MCSCMGRARKHKLCRTRALFKTGNDDEDHVGNCFPINIYMYDAWLLLSVGRGGGVVPKIACHRKAIKTKDETIPTSRIFNALCA